LCVYNSPIIFINNLPGYHVQHVNSIIMKHILAISTDAELLALLHRQLSDLGFHMTSANTREDLLAQVKIQRPDVLVLDFILGDSNAASVCHQVTSASDTCNIPVIILSDMPGIEQIGAKTGSFAVIKKPMQTVFLVENIIAALVQHA